MISRDIHRFRQFCRRHLHLEARTEHLSDRRVHPKIKAKTVFDALFYLGGLGLGALLRLDQFLRTWKGRRLFRVSRPLVSDTTLSRSLSGFGLAELHRVLQAVYAQGRQLGVGRCEVGQGRWRIGVIDGSNFGRFQASCFAQIGSVCLMGGLEAIPKRGKELPSSERLLRKLCACFGPRWGELLLLDGLYVAQGFLRACLDECHVEFLIKTQEAGLNVIQDARGLFRN